MKNFVYLKPFIFWLSLLVVLGLFFVLKSSHSSQAKENELHDIVDASPRKLRKQQRKELRELTQQTRYGVSKEIFINEGPLRRVLDLKAERSEIRVLSKRPHMRVQETFYNVNGLVQHELYYIAQNGKEVIYSDEGHLIYRDKKPVEQGTTLTPKQHFRYFMADEAVYDFHTGQLLAEECQFWTFTANGHEKVENPLALIPEAEGEAKRMTFFVGSDSAKNQFSAEFIKVQFTPEGGI